jgi:hypothetical protein
MTLKKVCNQGKALLEWIDCGVYKIDLAV